ncbi:MAG: DUF1513 domain-containing protein [Oceanospirillaceae bacterium]
MQRRQFNTYLTSILLSTAFSGVAIASTELSYASASVDKEGQHWLVVFNSSAVEKMRYPLPSRAHQVIKHPIKPWALVVARRPGQYLLVVDLTTAKLVKQVDVAQGQDFCGHLQISQNGRYLYTTENTTQTSQGLVVVRDMHNQFNLVQQFSSGGIGPHQLKLSADGNTMVVANGGIHTLDRVKLNLESMQSNLSYIDLTTQKITEQVALPGQEYVQLSIRHIDVNNSDKTLIAMQYQGEMTDKVPLVATHQRGQPLQILAIPDQEFYQLKQYCGSACFDRSGNTVAVSAPKGDKILFWNLAKNQFLGSTKVRDGCGITQGESNASFVVSSGRGKVYKIQANTQKKQPVLNNKSIQWDNHLALMS